MSEERVAYYADLEHHLRGLLRTIRVHIDQQAALDIEDFIEIGEYGLALDQLAEAFNVVMSKLTAAGGGCVYGFSAAVLTQCLQHRCPVAGKMRVPVHRMEDRKRNSETGWRRGLHRLRGSDRRKRS